MKIERAKEHLKEFEVSAELFREAYLTVIGLKEDPKTKQAFQYFTTLPISRFEGQPLLPFLQEMVNLVGNWVSGVEPHLRPRKRRSRFP